MTTPTPPQLEIRGRLWLWHMAVCQTQSLLGIAHRSRLATTQSNIVAETESCDADLKAFLEAKPSYSGGITTTDLAEFNEQVTRPFPVITECFSIHDACVELAIVYFAQLLNIGYGDVGTAAKNDKAFRDQHLEAISKLVWQTKPELDEFWALCDDIVTARNTMIGHADAEAFEIKHDTPVSQLKMHCVAWKHINFDYWRSFLEEFRVAILKHSTVVA